MTHTLYSIFFSHYVEKARWSLDRFQVPYHERRLMPLFHFPVVMWATRGQGGRTDRASSRYSTPLLITDGNQRLQDSGDIARWASRHYATPETDLYPTPEVAQIERYLHDELGPHSRRLVYHEMLSHPDDVFALARRNDIDAAQMVLLRMFYPFFKKGLTEALSISDASAEQSLTRVRAVFAEIEQRRAGRPWLVGDHLTAADITYACMAAPVLMPGPEYGYGALLPALDELPARGRALVEEMRASPTGRHVLGLFRDYRRVSVLQ